MLRYAGTLQNCNFFCIISSILATLLYQASNDGGYVDPAKLEEILSFSFTQKEMPEIKSDSRQLTNYQVVRLSQVIFGSSMESIALGYMNIDEQKIENLKSARRDDTEGFVRDVIKVWACRNPINQVQVSNLPM